MVFGRKKKRQKAEKSLDNSFTKGKSKVRRKPSFVSTPIKGRKLVKHRKSSGNKKPSKIIKTKKVPVVPARPQGNVFPPRPRVPPPPPPIDQMNNKLNFIKSSVLQQQKQMIMKENQQKRMMTDGGNVNQVRNRNKPAATSTLSQSVGNKCQQHLQNKVGPPKPLPRDRNSDDLQKWLQWRKGVNDQLVGYVLSEDKDGGQLPPPMASHFPNDFTADTIDSILHHAFNKEEPRSSLDKLSYMIYGIPRVKMAHKDCGNEVNRFVNVKENVMMHKAQYNTDVSRCLSGHVADISRCSSNASGGRLPRRHLQGNLFIQTNPLHSIPRYLPEPQSLDNEYQVPPIDYMDEYTDDLNERAHSQQIDFHERAHNQQLNSNETALNQQINSNERAGNLHINSNKRIHHEHINSIEIAHNHRISCNDRAHNHHINFNERSHYQHINSNERARHRHTNSNERAHYQHSNSNERAHHQHINSNERPHNHHISSNDRAHNHDINSDQRAPHYDQIKSNETARNEHINFNESFHNQHISKEHTTPANQNMNSKGYKKPLPPIPVQGMQKRQQQMALNDHINIQRTSENDSDSSLRIDSPPPRRPPVAYKVNAQEKEGHMTNYGTSQGYRSSEGQSIRSGITHHPQPHSPISVNMKPPVAGAVPTLLSGLQPYELPQLRQVVHKH